MNKLNYLFEMRRTSYYHLLGALIVGLLVRVPGVFWGSNFPTGWYGHHIDEYTHLVNAEMMINPLVPPRWNPHPYPKGLAAHVAVPILAVRLVEGKLFDKIPEPDKIIVFGRVISVFYGTATILVVFLLARLLFQDPRVVNLGVWIFALGGLHVSQSHFFVSDVPSLFWHLLGLYLLFILIDRGENESKKEQLLMWSAFCFGIAFGLKLFLVGLPSLILTTMVYRIRFQKIINIALFFLCGFVIVNFADYTPYNFYKTMAKGISDPYQFSRISSFFLYMIELPSIVSLPVFILFIGGIYFLAKKLFISCDLIKLRKIVLIVIVPVLINVLLIVFKLDHFPRHLIPLIPWISLVAAWSLVQIADHLRFKGMPAGLLIILFFVYLAMFIFDAERVFLQEPRNEAAKWLQQNIPQGTAISWQGHGWLKDYKFVYFPDMGRPQVIVMEMHTANHYLSGMSWKDSYPKDYRFIFAGRSQERVDAIQSLFKGTSEYKKVIKFSEGYFMPEYIIADRLIGNRSRNYIAEIVIFMSTNGDGLPQCTTQHEEGIKCYRP